MIFPPATSGISRISVFDFSRKNFDFYIHYSLCRKIYKVFCENNVKIVLLLFGFSGFLRILSLYFTLFQACGLYIHFLCILLYILANNIQ